MHLLRVRLLWILGSCGSNRCSVVVADLTRASTPCRGFANRKTEYIQAAAVDCLSAHAGDIPRDLAGLLALKGVGPKMAYLVLENAWGESQGIGVDIHVERITNRLGWHPKPTNKPSPNPEIARFVSPRCGPARVFKETLLTLTRTPLARRRNLEAWLPNDLWRPVNPLLVGFGQTVCKAVAPRCDACTLGPLALCPSFDPAAAGRARVKAERLARNGLKTEEAAAAAALALDKPVVGPKVEIGLEGEGDVAETAPRLVKMEPADADD